jgi:hypothetical protein
MQEELHNFTRNEVWELVERPKNDNVIVKDRYGEPERGE